jgi:hypothetical protein
MVMQRLPSVRFTQPPTTLGAAWRTLGCEMSWKRREFFFGAFAAGWSVATASAVAQQSDTSSADYSESVALVLFAPGGEQEIGLRLARLPGRRAATIWAGVDGDERSLSLADSAVLGAGAQATETSGESATFNVSDRWLARFDRKRWSKGNMEGTVHFSGSMHPGSEPPQGKGQVPVRMTALFRALHAPVLVRTGRMEVFGRGSARIELPDRTVEFAGFGKWHEQTGERPRFAPAFTYMEIVSEKNALLAVATEGGHYGFVLEDGRTTPVTHLDISAPGNERRFEVLLADDRMIQGFARTIRTSSVPIEGKRRPSTTVIVDTTLGRLVGHLNDWRPAAS